MNYYDPNISRIIKTKKCESQEKYQSVQYWKIQSVVAE